MPPVNFDAKMPVEFTLTDRAKVALGLDTPAKARDYIAGVQRAMVGHDLRREGDSAVGRFDVTATDANASLRQKMVTWVNDNKDKKVTFSEVKWKIRQSAISECVDPQHAGGLLSLFPLDLVELTVEPNPDPPLEFQPPQVAPRTT